MDKLYKIKPLEWVEWYPNMQAETPFGRYTVEERSWGYCFDEYYDEDTFSCSSIEEGKAAAEVHWRERILPMLTEV